jgi:outer membrane protein assembly factor BamB
MRTLALLICLSIPVLADWPDWRGPARDGISPEKNLPVKWSVQGENLAWKAPYGGRSAPVVHNNHVYLLNPAGKGSSLQERLMCLDADTGKVLWERKFNVYHLSARQDPVAALLRGRPGIGDDTWWPHRISHHRRR